MLISCFVTVMVRKVFIVSIWTELLYYYHRETVIDGFMTSPNKERRSAHEKASREQQTANKKGPTTEALHP
jgi:hypothetical protein